MFYFVYRVRSAIHRHQSSKIMEKRNTSQLLNSQGFSKNSTPLLLQHKHNRREGNGNRASGKKILFVPRMQGLLRTSANKFPHTFRHLRFHHSWRHRCGRQRMVYQTFKKRNTKKTTLAFQFHSCTKHRTQQTSIEHQKYHSPCALSTKTRSVFNLFSSAILLTCAAPPFCFNASFNL